MRYYQITVDAADTSFAIPWGGAPTYWFEINALGDANRQLVRYPDGTTLSYDAGYPHDAYDGLQQMVVDGDDAWWEGYRIAATDFEAMWQQCVPMNRISNYEPRLKRALPPARRNDDETIRF